MKNILCVFILLFFISCNTEPQPFVIGQDNCSFCKMPIADIKFGAEIITQKGKLYKFDDTGCMINFIKTGLGADEKIKNLFAVDYSDNKKFLDVNTAVFLVSENLRSPMNTGIAAFASRDLAEPFLKEFPGEIISWNELQLKLK